MERQSEPLARIVELTYIIASGYPDTATKLRQVSEELKDTADLPLKHGNDLKHAYRVWRGACEQYVVLVNELNRLVLLSLPDHYAGLKILPHDSRWHDPSVDWEVARAELVGIRAAAAKAAAASGDREPGPAGLGFRSARDLANEHDLPPEPLRRRLERWRKQNGDGWVEVPSSDRRPNEARFLYRPDAVTEVLDSMNRK